MLYIIITILLTISNVWDNSLAYMCILRIVLATYSDELHDNPGIQMELFAHVNSYSSST